MIFRLEIECDNAAFEGGDCNHEVARILGEARKKLREEARPIVMMGETKLRDINGNTVGFYEYREK